MPVCVFTCVHALHVYARVYMPVCTHVCCLLSRYFGTYEGDLHTWGPPRQPLFCPHLGALALGASFPSLGFRAGCSPRGVLGGNLFLTYLPAWPIGALAVWRCRQEPPACTHPGSSCFLPMKTEGQPSSVASAHQGEETARGLCRTGLWPQGLSVGRTVARPRVNTQL